MTKTIGTLQNDLKTSHAKRVRLSLKIRNKDETVDTFVQGRRAATTDSNELNKIAAMENRLKTIENMLESWTSPNGKTLIFDKFFNEAYDLWREKKPDENDEFQTFAIYDRPGLDKSKAVRFTDQAMFGWKRAVGGRDPKDVGLENIVHRGIVTDATNLVIDTVLARTPKVFDAGKNTITFRKGEEEFDALMGTVHGSRTAQMLTEYVFAH